MRPPTERNREFRERLVERPHQQAQGRQRLGAQLEREGEGVNHKRPGRVCRQAFSGSSGPQAVTANPNEDEDGKEPQRCAQGRDSTAPIFAPPSGKHANDAVGDKPQK